MVFAFPRHRLLAVLQGVRFSLQFSRRRSAGRPRDRALFSHALRDARIQQHTGGLFDPLQIQGDRLPLYAADEPAGSVRQPLRRDAGVQLVGVRPRMQHGIT